MLAASLSVLFSYGGWQLLSYVAPSVKDPQKNLPRAIVIGVSGVALIYLLINLSYLEVLGIGGLAATAGETQGMAVRMANSALGEGVGATFVTAAMAVSALGFLVATLITTPGIYVAMAREASSSAPSAACTPRRTRRSSPSASSAPSPLATSRGAWATKRLSKA